MSSCKATGNRVTVIQYQLMTTKKPHRANIFHANEYKSLPFTPTDYQALCGNQVKKIVKNKPALDQYLAR